jgi:lipopolysaccharide biosynthesis glycosyltransferase
MTKFKEEELSAKQFIPLLAVADYRMEVGKGVTLYSALRNLGDGYGLDIRLLSGAVGWPALHKLKKSLRSLHKPFRLSVIPISDKQFKGFQSFANTSLFTYARFLFQDMFSDLGKVLYIDVDTLVLGDLADLYATPLGENLLAAAVGRGTSRADDCWGILNYKELGIPGDTPYFNAGILVLDLAKWRKEGFAQRCMGYAAKYPELCIFWDQTVMNTLLAGNFTHLDQKWNQQFNGPDKSYLRDGILHYCGPDKPWAYENGLPQELNDIFFEELDRTAWKKWRPRPKIPFGERIVRKIKKTAFGF